MRKKIIFFGSGEYSIPVIKEIQSHGLELVLTITTETHGPLIEFLQEHNLSFLSTKVTGDKKIERQELWKKVADIQPTLGVLASFGAIIPQYIIDLFPQGIWNIHPSLLPKYKGPSPIQATILSGDTKTGVTIITLDDQVDHGPILTQETVHLAGNETTEQLKHALFKQGGEMIASLIQQEQRIVPTPQDHAKESWTEKITKEHGKIDLENPPEPKVLDRMIRAYYPWPSVWGQWKIQNGKHKIIKLLPEQKIQVEGKKIMTFKDFINGYQIQGTHLLKQLQLIE